MSKSGIFVAWLFCCAYLFPVHAQGPVWKWQSHCGGDKSDKTPDPALSRYEVKNDFTVRLDVTCFDYVSDTLTSVYSKLLHTCVPLVDTVLVPNASLASESVRIHNADCMQQGEWKIYNLWAQEVFVTTDLDAAWRAMEANGDLLPAGTYFYELRSTDGSGITVTGKILVVR